MLSKYTWLVVMVQYHSSTYHVYLLVLQNLVIMYALLQIMWSILNEATVMLTEKFDINYTTGIEAMKIWINQ